MDQSTKDKRRAYLYEWRKRNPDKIAGYNQAWYERNADKETVRKRSQYQLNPEVFKARSQAYRDKNRAKVNEQVKMAARRRKLRVMEAYGGAFCKCCGETTPMFLTIDHIDGCTKEQRKMEGQGSGLHAYLVRNGFPPGYQVLCFNCNLGRAANGGTCPHQLLQSA